MGYEARPTECVWMLLARTKKQGRFVRLDYRECKTVIICCLHLQQQSVFKKSKHTFICDHPLYKQIYTHTNTICTHVLSFVHLDFITVNHQYKLAYTYSFCRHVSHSFSISSNTLEFRRMDVAFMISLFVDKIIPFGS